MDGKIPLIIKWSGKEYEVYISEEDSVADLKREILYKTAVRPERQKLLNLKLKGMINNLPYNNINCGYFLRKNDGRRM